jgi:uncharacterized protein
VTLQILAESFSAQGVPVFLSDVKGDLAGLARPGSDAAKTHAPFTARAGTIGLADYRYEGFPVTFWDLFGEQGHPIRTTVAEMGPLLLSRMLELTDAQEGVLNIAFRVADEEGLPLLDLKDLQALLVWVGENQKDLSLRYGNVARDGRRDPAPAPRPREPGRHALLRRTGARTRRPDAHRHRRARPHQHPCRRQADVLAPALRHLLLWLLSELFEELPEVGDPDKPAGVLLRRGAPSVQRRVEGAGETRWSRWRA